MRSIEQRLILQTEALARNFTEAYIPNELRQFEAVSEIFRDSCADLPKLSDKLQESVGSIVSSLGGVSFADGRRPTTFAVLATLFASLAHYELKEAKGSSGSYVRDVERYAKKFRMPRHLVGNIARVVEAQIEFLENRSKVLEGETLIVHENDAPAAPLDQRTESRILRKRKSSSYDIFVHHIDGTVEVASEDKLIVCSVSDQYYILRWCLRHVGKHRSYGDVMKGAFYDPTDFFDRYKFEKDRIKVVNNRFTHLRTKLSKKLPLEKVVKFLDTSGRKTIKVGRIFKTSLIDCE